MILDHNERNFPIKFFYISFALQVKALSKIRTPDLSPDFGFFIESTMFCDGNFTASLKLENSNLDRVPFDTYSYKLFIIFLNKIFSGQGFTSQIVLQRERKLVCELWKMRLLGGISTKQRFDHL